MKTIISFKNGTQQEFDGATPTFDYDSNSVSMSDCDSTVVSDDIPLEGVFQIVVNVDD